MSGEGLAAVIASFATLVTALGGIAVSLLGQRESRRDRTDIRNKVDENTAVTRDTAAKVEVTATKVEEVHKSTAEINDKVDAVAASGTYKALPTEHDPEAGG